jgi:chromosome segregation ATPase
VVPAAALLRELEEGYVRALFNDMRGRVADIVARIRALREEYRSAEARLGEIRAAYEQNLTERFRQARKESLSALREEYKRVSARLTELRLKLTERAFETYNLLMGG